MEACLSSLSLSTTTMMMFLSVLSCFAFCRAASSPFPALPHFYFLAIGIEILEKGKKNMFFCLASLGGCWGERDSSDDDDDDVGGKDFEFDFVSKRGWQQQLFSCLAVLLYFIFYYLRQAASAVVLSICCSGYYNQDEARGEGKSP